MDMWAGIYQWKEAFMRIVLCLPLIFIALLTACSLQSTAPPSPASAITNTPLPAATLEPTQTPELTAAPITVIETSLESCEMIIEAKISSSGVLEVIFEREKSTASDSIVSDFGSPN